MDRPSRYSHYRIRVDCDLFYPDASIVSLPSIHFSLRQRLSPFAFPLSLSHSERVWIRAFLSKQRLRATGFTSEAKTEREKCAARVEGSCAPWVQRTRPESAHGSHNGYARRVNERSVAITAVCLWALFEKGKATQRSAVSSDQTRHLSAHRQRQPVLRYRSIKLVLGCRQSRCTRVPGRKPTKVEQNSYEKSYSKRDKQKNNSYSRPCTISF